MDLCSIRTGKLLDEPMFGIRIPLSFRLCRYSTTKGIVVKFVLQPWQLMLLIFVGWINRQQQEAKTRRVHFAGCVTNSDGGKSMQRMALNMTDLRGGFLTGKTHLIMDNDTRFSKAFCKVLSDVGVEAVRLLRSAPT